MQSTFILTRVHSYITLISTVSNFEYRWRHLRNKNMKHSWISANENFFIFYNVNVKKLNNLYFKSCLITNLADFWHKNTIFKVLYKGLKSIVFMYWWNAVVLGRMYRSMLWSFRGIKGAILIECSSSGEDVSVNAVVIQRN